MNRYTLFLLIAVLYCVSLQAVLWDNAAPIRQGVNIEWYRTGTETADGGAIYVWSDTKLGARDLYAQKVDASGNIVWGEPLLVDGKLDRQEDPVITRTSDNFYIIAWIDFSDDIDGNVYAQKVNSAGQLLWQTGGVPVCVHSGIQISLNIEPDNNGGAYVVWNDTRNPGVDLYGQHLSADGSILWPTLNGIPIANGDGDESYNTMWSDGAGGLMIGYVRAVSTTENLYIKRFLPNGLMAWDQPLHIMPNPVSQNKIKMAPIGDSSFVFTWMDWRHTDPDIYAQRVDINGIAIWPEPIVVFSDSTATLRALQENPRIVQTSDNAVIIVWEDKRNDPVAADLYAQKINLSGQRLWNPDGVPLCIADFGQLSPRMSADDNGGCYVVWDDARNDDKIDIYTQHLSSNGSFLWTANGLAVCTSQNEQSGSLVKISGSNIFINWMDMRNGSVGIYYQVLNTAGVVQLVPNGVQVFWGLSGDATKDQFISLPRQNDVIVIWQDTRFANMGYQIFYQIVNSDGTLQLEPNGRPLTIPSGFDQLNPSAVVLPDNSVAIVWEEKSSPPKVFGQLIDANCNRLWGDSGMIISDIVTNRQKDPKVSYEDGAIYIGWSNLDVTVTPVGTRNLFHVYGQKIVNNQKVWGTGGILVSEMPANDMLFECQFEMLKGRYFVWIRTSTNTATFNNKNVYVKLMNPDGTTPVGWSNYGVATSNYLGEYTKQFQPRAAITDGGLFVEWLDFRIDNVKNLYGQLISPIGQVVWDPLGVPLAESSAEQDIPSLIGGHSATFVWKEKTTGSNFDIAAQRFSLNGTPQWGPLGQFVSQGSTIQSSPNLARFPHCGMIAAWEDYTGIESDIYIKYIEEDGTIIGPPSGYVICNELKIQQYPIISILDNGTPYGNEAVIVWSDGRSSGKTPIYGLYAQKVADETTGINDDHDNQIVQLAVLQQNYPNPFNPETKISFSLSKDVKDINLSVYNLKGQKVKTVFEGKAIKGLHELTWDGKDDNQISVASGIYFYRLNSGNVTQTKKMILMK